MALKSNSDSKEIIAEINMTPLIDIMLVLLIIFMVTSSVSLESGLDIDLPKTKAATTEKEGSAILISMDKEETISVQGKKVSWEELGARIKQALEEENTKMVIFEGDQSARLSHAIQVMDIAKEAGADQFGIAAEEVSTSN